MAERAQIDFVSNDADFQKAARNVNRSLKMTDEQQKQVQQSSRKMYGTMTTGARRASRSIITSARAVSVALTTALGPIGLVAAAIGTLVSLAQKLGGAAVDVESATARLRATLQGLGQEVDKNTDRLTRMARQMSLTFGESRAEIINLQQQALRMGVSVQNVGRAIQRALDLAAFGGVEAEEALKGLQELAAGDAGAMEQLFPQLRRFTDQSLKLAEAQKLVAQSSGAAQRATQTFAGSWDVLMARIQDVAILLGQALLPSLTKILTELATNEQLWKNLAEAAEILAEAMIKAADALQFLGRFRRTTMTIGSFINLPLAALNAGSRIFGGGGGGGGGGTAPTAPVPAGPPPSPGVQQGGMGGAGGAFAWNRTANASEKIADLLQNLAQNGGFPAAAN